MAVLGSRNTEKDLHWPTYQDLSWRAQFEQIAGGGSVREMVFVNSESMSLLERKAILHTRWMASAGILS